MPFIYIRHSQAIKELGMAECYASELIAELGTPTPELAWLLDTHTHPAQGISPFSVAQSLKLRIPFQCYPGVVDKKVIPLALSVWFPITRLSSKPSPHPYFLFTFHIHTSHRHNLYHLTHVVYQTCSADETFLKCPMVFHSKPIFKGKPPHEVWLLQVITYDLPAVCILDTFIE